jgi:hypothetical protein
MPWRISTTCRTSTSCKPEVLANVYREYEENVEWG